MPMPGTASRKEKRAAASRVSPSVRAIVIVTPEREVPGISASACAQPIRIASRQPTEYSSRAARPKRSAIHMRAPKTASSVATATGLRSFSSISPPKARPTTPTGIVPITMHQARRASGVIPPPANEPNQARVIARSSRRKYATTANSVPTCTATSKASPWSCQPSRYGTSTRWPELEIGRNSDSPWTIARTMA